MQALITFDSTHHALRGEQILEQAQLGPDIIPTPREITASCGLSLSLPASLIEQAILLLRAGNVEFRAVYDQLIVGGVKSYQTRKESSC